jgi:hypothetical protein
MIRVLRSGSLLVSFSLLASAATANAECAWVQWRKDPQLLGWYPVAATREKIECDRALEEREKWSRAAFPSPSEQITRLTVDYCFPDTGDPRGPKGK